MQDIKSLYTILLNLYMSNKQSKTEIFKNTVCNIKKYEIQKDKFDEKCARPM